MSIFYTDGLIFRILGSESSARHLSSIKRRSKDFFTREHDLDMISYTTSTQRFEDDADYMYTIDIFYGFDTAIIDRPSYQYHIISKSVINP